MEEVLGISTKRLLSIINATKCPTDTDTSDSDVEKVEGSVNWLILLGYDRFRFLMKIYDIFIEHISLEEISSDSNDELNKPKKKKKRGVAKKGLNLDILLIELMNNWNFLFRSNKT